MLGGEVVEMVVAAARGRRQPPEELDGGGVGRLAVGGDKRDRVREGGLESEGERR